MYEDLIKALRCCDAHCETCQFGDKERAYTCTVTGSAADAIEALQAELQPFQEAAAEYGIDAKTMLTLAKSQIATAQENISLRAERDALLKSFTVTSQPIKVIQPKGVVE